MAPWCDAGAACRCGSCRWRGDRPGSPARPQRPRKRTEGRENAIPISLDASPAGDLLCRSLRGFGPGGKHSGEAPGAGFFGAGSRGHRDGGSRKAQPHRVPGAAHRLRPGRSSEGFGPKSTAGDLPPRGLGRRPDSPAPVGTGFAPVPTGRRTPRGFAASAKGSLGVFRVRRRRNLAGARRGRETSEPGAKTRYQFRLRLVRRTRMFLNEPRGGSGFGRDSLGVPRVPARPPLPRCGPVSSRRRSVLDRLVRPARERCRRDAKTI